MAAPGVLPAWAEAAASQFALAAHFGRYPSSVASDDPARSSVGVIYPAHFGRDAKILDVGEYATAFLVSDCYAVTSAAAVEALASQAGLVRAATGNVGALIFKLAASADGSADTSTTGAWQSTVIASGGLQSGLSAEPAWSLLRLENCGSANATAMPPTLDDSPATAEGSASGPVYRTRQLGILTMQSLTAAALDIDPSAAALSMMGGPLQMFDASSRQWTTIGIVIAPNANRAGYPASAGMTSSAFLVAGTDDGVTSFFRFEPQVLPLSEIRRAITEAIERDIMPGSRHRQADQPDAMVWDGRPRS